MAIGLLRKSLTGTTKKCYNIERSAAPYIHNIREVQEVLNSTELLIGFNIKFDLHWIRRYGITIPPTLRVYDCQLAFHILRSQEQRYPSLDGLSNYYSNPNKLDHIKLNYWDKGIDTDKIPWHELEEYLLKDLEVTETNYLSLFNDKQLTDKKRKLIELHCEDLLCLQEMEWNGLLYDSRESLLLSGELDKEIQRIDSSLDANIGSPIQLNYASNDHKSIILYGGKINETKRTPYYKKDGTISATRTHSTIIEHIYPRLVVPPKGSELAKNGFYSTDEGTLKKVRPTGKAKKIVESFIRRGEIQRLNGTYYFGIPELMKEMGWDNGYLHGNLNQCVAITGRLSSDKPNLQNNPEEVDRLFRSRFD